MAAKLPSKSAILLVCPVTGKRADPVFLDEDAPEGEFVTVEPDETAPNLPVGWGRLQLDIVAPNPDVAKIEAIRQRERAQRDAMLADPDVPEEQKAHVRDTFDAVLDEQYPVPENDMLVRRLELPVLSDEAMATIVAALKAAGLPIKDVA